MTLTKPRANIDEARLAVHLAVVNHEVDDLLHAAHRELPVDGPVVAVPPESARALLDHLVQPLHHSLHGPAATVAAVKQRHWVGACRPVVTANTAAAAVQVSAFRLIIFSVITTVVFSF